MKEFLILFIFTIVLVSCQTGDDTEFGNGKMATEWSTWRMSDTAPSAPNMRQQLYLTFAENSGNLQTIDIGTETATLIAKATLNGEPISGVTIEFSVNPTQTEYAGVSPDSVSTDENGEVSTILMVKAAGSFGVWVSLNPNDPNYTGNTFSFLVYATGVAPDQPQVPVDSPVDAPVVPTNPTPNPVTPNVDSGGEYWAVVKRTVGSSTHYNIYPNTSKSDEIIEHAHQNGQGTPGHFISVVDDDEYQIWYYWAWYYNTYILNLDDDDNTNDNRKEENGDKIYYSEITWFGLNQYDAAVESINP